MKYKLDGGHLYSVSAPLIPWGTGLVFKTKEISKISHSCPTCGTDMMCSIKSTNHAYKHVKTYHEQQVNLLSSEYDDDHNRHHWFENTNIYFYCYVCDKNKFDDENRKYCNDCKTYITTDFCTSCGLKSSIKDVCRFCNKPSTTKFCGNCGNKRY